jgi:hypothetical protein
MEVQMPLFGLFQISTGERRSKVSPFRGIALAEFAAETGKSLTFEETGVLSDFIFEEHDEGSAFVGPGVPLFIARDR